jgi:hypothetical protein
MHGGENALMGIEFMVQFMVQFIVQLPNRVRGSGISKMESGYSKAL